MASAANTLGVFLVILYHITVLYLGIMSGRKVNLNRSQSKTSVRDNLLRWKSTTADDRYLLKLFLADRSVDVFVGTTSLTG